MANKSVEVGMEDGEMCISTGNCKIFFASNFFSSIIQTIRVLPNALGISIVGRKKEK